MELGKSGVAPADVIAVARHGAPVVLNAEAVAAIEASRAIVDATAAGDEPAYGLTTGFGSLTHPVIPADRLADLQANLVRSHAAGMGDPVEPEVVRAMMFLRSRTLSMGYSGASLGVVRQIVSMGWGAARKLRTVLDNLRMIIGVEVLAATRALQFRAPLESAPATGEARDLVISQVGDNEDDRFLAPDLAATAKLVGSGELVRAVEKEIGTLV